MSARGFREKLVEAIGEDIELHIVPDGHAFDMKNKIVYVFEEIKTHGLSNNKMIQYGKLWHDCEYYGWEVILTVRYKRTGLIGNICLSSTYSNDTLGSLLCEEDTEDRPNIAN